MATPHNWSNYVFAGFKGVQEVNSTKLNVNRTYQLMVGGTVPLGSGLSSSSALVCSSALAFMVANNLSFSKTELATLSAKCERYIGMESGGMDQAISFLAEDGKAKKIYFNPLTTKDVCLPSKASFVIASSLVEANKHATSGSGYNMRVVECRLAAVVLSKILGVAEWNTKVRQLCHVQQLTSKSLADLINDVETHLHKEKYTIEEIAKLLELETDQVIKDYSNSNVDPKNKFDLHGRSLHVFSEIKRVEDFDLVCGKEEYDDQLKDLGNLMNESHFSCRDNFDCSSSELNTLTEICRNAGALGSRLTGAGWGGWTISLVPTEKLEEFLKVVTEKMYFSHIAPERGIENFMLATKPGPGACVIKLC
eukprot:TRINITY_DN2439_c0_g1_i2.p1 TRINITY_DN2439_c0_g1~~TRINITY_DN2439_c0_g1_i2.p1  ORF type:complete len:366 (-),score=79.51 TRINITY_DN2439_c0_g1_i2:32-1129(-)